MVFIKIIIGIFMFLFFVKWLYNIVGGMVDGTINENKTLAIALGGFFTFLILVAGAYFKIAWF